MSIKDFFTKKENRKQMIIASSALALVVIIGIGAGAYAVSQSNRSKRYSKMIKTAEKDISNLDYDEAISMYQEAIELDPHNPDAYLGLAELYEQQGDMEQALEVLDEALINVSDDDVEIVQNAIIDVQEEVATPIETTAVATPTPIPVPDETEVVITEVTTEATTEATTETTVVETTVVETIVAETEDETIPTEPLDEEEITLDYNQIFADYLNEHAEELGGYSVLGRVRENESLVLDGGEYLPAEYAQTREKISGIATFMVDDWDGDEEPEALVISINKDVEGNIDNEYTAEVLVTVLELDETGDEIAVIANESTSVYIIDKRDIWLAFWSIVNDENTYFSMFTSFDGIYYVVEDGVLVEVAPVDEDTLDDYETTKIYEIAVNYTSNYGTDEDDADDVQYVELDIASRDYMNLAYLLDNYEDRIASVNYVIDTPEDGEIPLISIDEVTAQMYPDLADSVDEIVQQFPEIYENQEIDYIIVRSDSSIFSFVVKAIDEDDEVTYVGYNFDTQSGEFISPTTVLGSGGTIPTCVIGPDMVMVLGREISFVPYPDEYDYEWTRWENYFIDVTEFGAFTFYQGDANVAQFEIEEEENLFTITSDVLNPIEVSLEDFDLETIQIKEANISGNCYIYVIGESLSEEGTLMYTIPVNDYYIVDVDENDGDDDEVVEPEETEVILEPVLYEVNPFALIGHITEQFYIMDNSGILGDIVTVTSHYLGIDGSIRDFDNNIYPMESLEVVAIEDITVVDTETLDEIELTTGSSLVVVSVTADGEITFTLDDGAMCTFVMEEGDFENLFEVVQVVTDPENP